MPVKDPKFNSYFVTGKVSKEYEERQAGEFINGKIHIEVFNLSYDATTKSKVYKPSTWEVKTMGRPDSRPGSPLAEMRALKVGMRCAVAGSIEEDFWSPKDNPEKEYSKKWINANRIGALETEDKPAAKKPEQAEVEAGTTEDDFPF